MREDERKRMEFDAILKNRGKILSRQQILELFNLSPTTCIKDTWMFSHGLIENIAFDQWRIFSF